MRGNRARTLLGVLSILASFGAAPSWGGGLAILETVLSDNGDGDGFADTRETVTLRLRVQNTTAAPLTNVVVQLDTTDDTLVCIVEQLLAVGNLAAGEIRLTDAGFTFTVADLDRAGLGLGPFQDLSAGFELTATAQPAAPAVHPSRLRVDLDLDVSGGTGPTTFLESFESQTLGAFEVQNLDAGAPSNPVVALEYFDGTRCQYSDPDWPNSKSYQQPTAEDCYPSASLANSDAVFWGLSGPTFSPLGGRAFSGVHSLVFGIDLGPPENWTTPFATLEAARTIDAIPLGWSGAAPVLSIKHQVSLVDSRSIVNAPEGTSLDRAVVMVQVADAAGQPVGPWIKLDPHQNVYDQQPTDLFFNCTFDPIDDGNTEDDFFDPNDPERLYGPSSTCYPEFAFSFIGETSSPANPVNIGSADGPGLAGQWGIGTWIESRFDLGRFRGRSIRVRFLVSGIKNSPVEEWEEYFNFNPDSRDDGWWIDDVTIEGALTVSASATADGKDNSLLPDPPPWADPDLDAVCGGDNCPGQANPDQADSDSDGVGLVCDCTDSDASVYPGAPEINDGKDNQCPGNAGHGMIDEIAGTAGFFNANKNQFSWPAQSGAIRYQVARAESPTFTSGCTTFPLTGQTSIVDAQAVPPNGVRFYLVRSFLPNKGSWGQSSDGQAIVVPCAP